MAISQQDRLIRIDTPLGEDTFVMLSFTGTESLSKPFLFDLHLASEKSDISSKKLVGKNVTVTIRSADHSERFFNGIVIEFSPAANEENESTSEYTAVLAPALWKLKQCYDCRIFQDMSVTDIISEVLSPAALGKKGIKDTIDFRMEATAAYNQREFCMQYNESDFDFISRLCEDEGIFYYFEHRKGRHALVFADASQSLKPHAAGAGQTVNYQRSLGGDLDREVITALQVQQRLTVATYAAGDYNFRTPDNPMGVSSGTLKSNSCAEGECYQYPGGYDDANSGGEQRALIRMQEHDARMAIIRGTDNCRSFCPGYRFTLQEYPIDSMNGQQYVITSVTHQAVQALGSGSGQGDHYGNDFACIPHKVPFRPERRTPRPVMAGNLTAIVTGPPGKEIHTDTDGHRMVKVKFFFDRRDTAARRGDMSCFIRVSQAWAGNGYGTVFIPRIGQEVIVGFVDGDCDRPIITGRVYHGMNKAPHHQDREETQSVIMTSSTPGNNGYNEICFEDQAGEEKITTHAAKDQVEVVENDLTTTVNRHQRIAVVQNRTLNVKQDEATTVDGGRAVTVQNSERHTNTAGFLHKVGNDYVLKVNGNITIDASGTVTISGAKVSINP
jgi:type VI secretion system secreted protein VgrG